jgi:DNA-binding NtrC family response regulator
MASILVIDDSDSCRVFLRDVLTRVGHDVFELADGRRVAAFLAVICVDVIITDLFMPGADGLETIRSVRQHAPAIPVIGIAGAESRVADCYVEAMSLLGAAAVLLKPLDGKAVLLAVDRLIADAGAPQCEERG